MGALTCMLKVIFAPVILLAQSLWIYVIGCFSVYVDRAARGVACGLCVCCGRTFKDRKFPAASSSIGAWKGKTVKQLDQEVTWRRIQDICACAGQQGAKLVSGDINPADICQGQLGDCWLMSACACLANQTGAIQRCFLTREYTHYGKYRVRLYDGITQRWRTVVIDDWLPCDKKTGKPLFAKPCGDEAWVMLLEKAMAKFKGSYAALDGGSTLWALQALTGDVVTKFKWDTTKNPPGWQRMDLVHPTKQPAGGQNGDVKLALTPDVLPGPDMFQTMLWYSRRRCTIAASSGSGKDNQHKAGIVQGHAYAVTDVREVGGFQLVRLRNPWGAFEWQGAWGDNSSLWKQHPKVARALDFAGAADDGAFWMAWPDFSAHFANLDFCIRTTGWDDLHLDIHEQHPCCGPMLGCILGCARFWCCCQGCRALCCAREARKYEPAPIKGGAMCADCMV